MKFTLKSAALFILILSLVVAVVTTTQQVSQLKNKLDNLRKTHGLVTQDFGQKGDRFELVPIGHFTSDYVDVFLLRISNIEKYRLRIHYFDGVSGNYRTDTHDLSSTQAAIRILPSENQIYVHDAILPVGKQTFLDIDASDHVFVMPGKYGGFGFTDQITDAPIHGYCILTESKSQPVGIVPGRYADRTSIEDTCKRHKMRCVWFTIESRKE